MQFIGYRKPNYTTRKMQIKHFVCYIENAIFTPCKPNFRAAIQSLKVRIEKRNMENRIVTRYEVRSKNTRTV